MPQAMLTLFVMTSLDEWPEIQRRMAMTQCTTCGESQWSAPLLLLLHSFCQMNHLARTRVQVTEPALRMWSLSTNR